MKTRIAKPNAQDELLQAVRQLEKIYRNNDMGRPHQKDCIALQALAKAEGL